MKRSVCSLGNWILAVWLILLLTAQISVDDGQVSGDSSTPHVTRMRAAVKDDMVKITWTDSEEATGPVWIYRAAEPFSTAWPSQASLLAKIPYGTQVHIDLPPSAGPWFYYALASDQQAEPYDLILLLENSLINPVTVSIPTSNSTPEALGGTDQVDETTVFAPFVSQLRVTALNSSIEINWQDSRDALGPVFIFRSPVVFTIDNLGKSQFVTEVPYGTQSYSDKPPSPGPWHYFVAATDDRGTRYDIILPYGNTNLSAVKGDLQSQPPAAIESIAITDSQNQTVVPPELTAEPTAEPLPSPDAKDLSPAGVTIKPQTVFYKVEAQVQGDAVAISFETSSDGENTLLYRRAAPIRQIADLLDAIIISAGPAVSPIIDYPVPGIAYYYALLDEYELKTGIAKLEIGVNSTITAATVPAGRYRIGLPGPTSDIRAMPLPLISLSTMGELTLPAVPVTLSVAANKAIQQLIADLETQKLPERKPRAFPQDLEAPAGGEEYTLRSIVQSSFARREWTKAVEELTKYLSLSRTAASEARARYYLGQSYYFLSRYHEALFEFLMVKEQYGSEANEWIQAVLRHLIDT